MTGKIETPTEPNDAMIEAGCNKLQGIKGLVRQEEIVQEIYQAMIGASPANRMLIRRATRDNMITKLKIAKNAEARSQKRINLFVEYLEENLEILTGLHIGGTVIYEGTIMVITGVCYIAGEPFLCGKCKETRWKSKMLRNFSECEGDPRTTLAEILGLLDEC